MTMLDHGFYTALGTPVDSHGKIIPASLVRQIDEQISSGAAGLLFLGSMGIQCSILSSQCAIGSRLAADAVKGRVPLFVGVMDNGIERVLERINALKGLPLEGVVMTTPYYFVSDADSIVSYFSAIASRSHFPVYLYDLPGVTKIKITLDIVRRLFQCPNIRGIKTGDLVLARQLMFEQESTEKFNVLFSGLDVFDAAWKYGLSRNLDGMFACTPATTAALYRSLKEGDFSQAAFRLNQILSLRDLMAKYGIFPSFTFVMNSLGYEGNFAPDYMPIVPEDAKDVLIEKMKELGEI